MRRGFSAGNREKLREISGQLERILDGDSDERITVFTDDVQLQQLAEQINRLLDDRQKTRADNRRARDTEKKMLSNISHDIKTPMTVILGYLEMIRKSGDPEGRMLQKVEQKAEQVMELINRFFTLAKLEAGDADLVMGKVDVGEVCRESVLDFYEMLSEKDFSVDIDIPEHSVFVLVDRNALQRILENLISNAIRYGDDGKYLGVALRMEGDDVWIDVADKGQGIEKVYASAVFDRLFTMEDSRNSRMQGNGLGLTIARHLARQMGGDITLYSEPSVRTVFTLRLKKSV